MVFAAPSATKVLVHMLHDLAAAWDRYACYDLRMILVNFYAPFSIYFKNGILLPDLNFGIENMGIDNINYI